MRPFLAIVPLTFFLALQHLTVSFCSIPPWSIVTRIHVYSLVSHAILIYILTIFRICLFHSHLLMLIMVNKVIILALLDQQITSVMGLIMSSKRILTACFEV